MAAKHLTALLLLAPLALLAVLHATGQNAPDPADPAAPGRTPDLVGDGRADDTAALRRLVAEACRPQNGRPAPRLLVLPPGDFRITEPLVLTREHNNLVIEGTGGMALEGNTRLIWDGPQGGNLIECWAQKGLQLRDLVLDGNEKAGLLLRVNSTDRRHPDTEYFKRFGQRSASGYTIERVRFINADTGISLSDSGYINADCSTFSHCQFYRLETGIRMHSVQNLAYNIVRPDFGYVGTGLWVTGGGFLNVSLFNSHHTDVAIRLEGQGINTGVFHFSGVRPEQGTRTPGKRPVLLMASGETNVKLVGAQTTANAVMGETADLETPSFILGPSANVVVESSQLTGRVARLTGAASDVPTFITFSNCRFRIGADPRTGIETDEHSGFKLVDCVVTVDDPKAKPYKIADRIMIPELVRYPKQAKGQPGYE